MSQPTLSNEHWESATLANASVPATIPKPDEPGWESVAPIDRATAMVQYANTFPAPAHSHIQAAEYAVYQYFEAIAKRYGGNKESWDSAVAELQNKVQDLKLAVENKEAPFERDITDSAELLAPVTDTSAFGEDI